MRHIQIIALILVFALMSAAAMAEKPDPAEVGKVAPDFELETLDGDMFRLSDCLGKVVFLNIWATWCPPCVEEMPDIQALYENYSDDLVVIGVSVDETPEEVRDFIAENGYTYTFAMDTVYQVSGLLYPTYYIPNSIFIDPKGIVVSMDVGASDYATMEARLLSILAEDRGE